MKNDKASDVPIRIAVDFNTMMADPKSRVHINTAVHPELLEVVRPGLAVVLYEPADLEVSAVLEYDEAHRAWYGVPDWSTRRDLS